MCMSYVSENKNMKLRILAEAFDALINISAK